MLQRMKSFSNLFGINLSTSANTIKSLQWFFSDYKKLKAQLKGTTDFKFGKWYPMLNDKHQLSGEASGHYFHQDLLVAQKVFLGQPTKHVDIGSSVSGLVAHIASFRSIEVFDIRPLAVEVENIKFLTADFMNIEEKYIDYCDSLSCLHVIEHFGLGRYNDPINANGHIVGLQNIYKVLKKGGKFYFSTPMGPQRIEFNAHRVFNLSYLLDLFKNDYSIATFSYVDDVGLLHKNVALSNTRIDDNFGCHFGCAIFELTKL